MSDEKPIAELPLDTTADEFVKQKWRSRGWSNDMSPEAIMRRLKIVSDLYEAWRFTKAGKLAESRDAEVQPPEGV